MGKDLDQVVKYGEEVTINASREIDDAIARMPRNIPDPFNPGSMVSEFSPQQLKYMANQMTRGLDNLNPSQIDDIKVLLDDFNFNNSLAPENKDILNRVIDAGNLDDAAKTEAKGTINMWFDWGNNISGGRPFPAGGGPSADGVRVLGDVFESTAKSIKGQSDVALERLKVADELKQYADDLKLPPEMESWLSDSSNLAKLEDFLVSEAGIERSQLGFGGEVWGNIKQGKMPKLGGVFAGNTTKERAITYITKMQYVFKIIVLYVLR